MKGFGEIEIYKCVSVRVSYTWMSTDRYQVYDRQSIAMYLKFIDSEYRGT